MINRVLFILVIFQTSFIALAQSGAEIKGNITSTDGVPLEFANVFLLDADSTLKKGTYADENGTFEFNDISFGNYILGASMVGYSKSYSDLISISSATKYTFNVELPEGTMLNEVVVAGNKPLFERQADRTVINVENSIVNAGSDAWEILQKAPGVEVDNNDQISVLGKQGTIVMIDGRRTFLSGEELANLLKSTPSNNLEKIEIITNPSAKYDASGNAGIINIVNKKNIVTGFNSNISLNTGAGWNFFYNPAMNFNYRSRKINLFGNYGFANRDVSRELGLTRRIRNESQNVVFDQRNDILIDSKEHLYGLGLDYYLNDNNTLGFSIRGFNKDDVEGGSSNSSILDEFSDSSNLLVGSESDAFLDNYSINFNYQLKLNADGSSLSVDVNKIRYDIADNEFFSVGLYRLPARDVISEQDLRNLKDSNIDIQTYQADYTYPFNKKTTLDAGFKLSDVHTENDIQFDSLISGAWVNDVSKTNTFNYDETVYAAYTNINSSINKFKISAGLRMEHTESVGNSVSLNQETVRSYTNFFPSASVTYPISEGQKATLSYSRRIDRPRYQWLNPFIFFFDPFTFYQGNPLLRPQYTNNFEASYSKGDISISAGYSETLDAMSFVTIQVDSTLTGIASNANLDKFFNYNLTISIQKQLTDWWSTFAFYSTFYNYYDSRFENADVGLSQVSHRVNVNNSFSLPASLKGELSVFYQSPAVFGLSLTKPFYVMNMGVQRSFLKKKLNAKLVFNDVLNSTRRRGSTNHKNQNLDFFFRRMNSRITLNLTYRMGKSGLSSRKRKAGAGEENSRVVTEGQ